MRIVIDARLYGIENAGLGRYTQKLIENLQLVDNKNEYFILLKPKYANNLTLARNFEPVACNIAHYSFAEQTKLPKILKQLQPDVIHFPHFNVPYNLKLPYVVTIHDMLMHKFKGKQTTTQPFLKYIVKRIGYKKIFASALKNAQMVIVPTKHVKNDLRRFFKVSEERLTVTYEGVDMPLPAKLRANEVLEKYKIDKPFFIYMGNAYPHKNLSRAIEAMVYLNEYHRNHAIFVISSARNVFSERIEKAITQFNAQEYVKYVGFVPDDDLAVLLKRSVGFLYPSLEEGFGLQGLEAMINKTLVIASDIPVFREVYKNHALYFNPFDFTSIAQQLNQAIEMDLDNRKKQVQEASEFAKHYSWQKMAQETLQVYENVFANNS